MKDKLASPLDDLVAAEGLPALNSTQSDQFRRYLDLLLRWNARMNLTAVREPENILRTHFLECIVCADALPAGISSLLDLGSGAGFPGIPISICKPQIAVTLTESQAKKAAFLNEVVRSLSLETEVVAGRAESISTKFDCVTMRAVDRMSAAVQVGSRLLNPEGWLAILTTTSSLDEIRRAAGAGFVWNRTAVPGSDQRTLALGRLE